MVQPFISLITIELCCTNTCQRSYLCPKHIYKDTRNIFGDNASDKSDCKSAWRDLILDRN